MEQNRLRSKVLWVSVTALIVGLIGDWGLYSIIGIEQELIQKTITGIITIAGLFGVINDPTNKDGL